MHPGLRWGSLEADQQTKEQRKEIIRTCSWGEWEGKWSERGRAKLGVMTSSQLTEDCCGALWVSLRVVPLRARSPDCVSACPVLTVWGGAHSQVLRLQCSQAT